MSEKSKPPEELELRIVKGLHTGAALKIRDPQISIGSDVSCDIVLLDKGVGPNHMQLVHEPQENKWFAEPEHRAVELNTPFAVGDAVLLITPSEYPWEPFNAELFNAELLLPNEGEQAPTDAVAETATPNQKAIWQVNKGVTMLILLLALVIVGYWWYVEVSSQLNPDPPPEPPKAAPVAAPNPHVETPAAKVADESQLPFAIREVVMGPVSFVVLENNQRVYVGEVVEGYLLESIQAQQIVWSGPLRIEMAW